MNQEMVKAEKRFANHKARLDILDENVRVLNWRQPGTQAYAIRAVMAIMCISPETLALRSFA